MKRNKFSLSNYKLFTCNQGELIPCGLTEVIPGDTIQQSTTALIRMAPLLAPVMHPVHVKIHHWFVPHRIIWEDFEDFITGGEDGLDASVFPTVTDATGLSGGSLGDYLGIPTGVAGIEFSALPYRAYAKVFNEAYRNEDLTTELNIDTSSGADTTTSDALQNVQWDKDYFVSAQPDTQLGDEVTLPLGETAKIKGKLAVKDTSGDQAYLQVNGSTGTDLSAALTDNDHLWADHNGTNALYTDLTDASPATINQLREAFALQRYAEARQRYGSRYTEYLRYLGVRSSDARLQRPEYLGGGKQTVQFSEVLQTGVDSTDGGLGTMGGHGIAAMRSNRYRKFFEEHGYVVSLMSVKPRSIYAQGLPKTFNRRTKEDFFQRELQHIGMEEILNKELYAAHSSPEGTFGYQDRYDSYRKSFSSIAGEFRNGGGLDHWHLARHFASDPALNDSFVTANPTDRIYASTSTDQLYVMASHSIQARRMMAKRGTPGRITF